MIVIRNDLDTKYAFWFYGIKNADKVKEEILRLFSEEPETNQVWTEQDIYEQSRKIIARSHKKEVIK